MSANALKRLMQKVATGASLSEDEIKDAFELMMSGVATPAQMAAFLMGLRVRGETLAETCENIEYWADLAEQRWRKMLESVLAGAAVVFLTAIIVGVI